MHSIIMEHIVAWSQKETSSERESLFLALLVLEFSFSSMYFAIAMYSMIVTINCIWQLGPSHSISVHENDV